PRRGPAGRGRYRPQRLRAVLRERRPPPHGPELLPARQLLPGAGGRRRHTDKARVRGAATATYRRQLRELPTQPRRARLRTAHERATGARAGRARAGEGDAHLRPWLQAPSGATAQQRRTPAPPG